MHSWKSWGNNQYTSIADVIAEIIDNSIQANTGKNGVYIDITTENGQRWLTIEDGGRWDPITTDVASRCFGYGTISSEKKKDGLNEHNCGLKNSLAYLDMTNNRWFIQIVQDGTVWTLKAPYKTDMELKTGIPYQGKLNLANSTLIRVPVDDTQFKTLYERTPTGKTNDDKLGERLRLYLATMWMMHTDIINKNVPIYYNGEVVEPYSFDREDGTEVMKYDKTPLVAGNFTFNVEVRRVQLLPQYRKDHPIFKRTIEHAGVFIFKNGRLINKVPEFKQIYGITRDGHYSGKVLIVNVTGDSRALPETCTTKNGFSSHDSKLQALYDCIRTSYSLYGARTADDLEHKIVERELVRRFGEIKKKLAEKRIGKGTYEIREEMTLKLQSDGVPLVNKEKIDLLEIDKTDKCVTIWEAKKTALTVENLRQLFFYYRNIKHYSSEFDGWDIECKFLVTSLGEPSKQYNDELEMLQKYEPGFNPDVEHFSSFGIHP
jgi:hypothetical protein